MGRRGVVQYPPTTLCDKPRNSFAFTLPLVGMVAAGTAVVYEQGPNGRQTGVRHHLLYIQHRAAATVRRQPGLMMARTSLNATFVIPPQQAHHHVQDERALLLRTSD